MLKTSMRCEGKKKSGQTPFALTTESVGFTEEFLRSMGGKDGRYADLLMMARYNIPTQFK
ncbi:MAG: hypothetical protein ACOX7X_12425 [Methanosarcina flavescens]|jgi:hypothetical protein|uniref:hypothetical protein n=1 Tax=Methanosarcina flavescens TaxID=1715806 RepID=UPI0006C76B5E|nr:hypothetical protein [Methanosarcina flavescens]